MDADATKYIRGLIEEGEHQQLDFKFEISDARKIARTLSAFSNTEGGRLLIGVKDNGRIKGVRSDEEYYMAESAATIYCKPEVNFEPRSHQIDGKNVLEIYIPPVSHRPVYARDAKDRWMAYIRVKDENFLASIIQLQVWKEEHKTRGKLLEFTRSEEFLLRYLEKDQGLPLKKIKRDTGYGREELINLLTKLVLFDVVEMKFREGEMHYMLRESPGI
jgi:Schlafen, AlbA_2